MRLKVIECSFVITDNWVFKLVNEYKIEFYIMDSDFYVLNNLKSPITKHELDYLDKGMWINAEVKTMSDRNVVTRIY